MRALNVRSKTKTQEKALPVAKTGSAFSIEIGALEELHHSLRDASVQFHLAEVKGPVMDRLRRIGFVDEIGADPIFRSIHRAMPVVGLCLTGPGLLQFVQQILDELDGIGGKIQGQCRLQVGEGLFVLA